LQPGTAEFAEKQENTGARTATCRMVAIVRLPTLERKNADRRRLLRAHVEGCETGYSGRCKGLSMSTNVLAYVILFMGFMTFLAGAFGALMLLLEEMGKTERVPFRYYAAVVGLISGGLGMIGIGQSLRLLLLILGKGSL
jgi:hypothetical protein